MLSMWFNFVEQEWTKLILVLKKIKKRAKDTLLEFCFLNQNLEVYFWPKENFNQDHAVLKSTEGACKGNMYFDIMLPFIRYD